MPDVRGVAAGLLAEAVRRAARCGRWRAIRAIVAATWSSVAASASATPATRPLSSVVCDRIAWDWRISSAA